MKKVDLFPGILPSVLGFGCAPILGSVDGPTSLRALNVAWDQGINYFDVAPSYGYGEAEAFLGAFLRGKRDEAFIATKFGIEAHIAAAALRPLKNVVRSLRGAKRAEPQSSGASQNVTSRLLIRKTIKPDLMVKSLERSLKRLRTDHVDVLLIHEPLDRILNPESVIGTAKRLAKDGKIRAYGIAGSYNQLEDLHSEIVPALDILQIEVPSTGETFKRFEDERKDKPNILFGVVKSRRSYAPENQSVPESLLELSQRFPRSLLLCSMFGEEHLRANAQVF